MNNIIPIFVIGVARAGTTLTSRIINAHSEVGGSIIDSFDDIYKAARVELARTLNMDLNIAAPLCDAYFSKERRQLAERVQDADLEKIDISAHRRQYAEIACDSSKKYSPVEIESDFFNGPTTCPEIVRLAMRKYSTSPCKYFCFKTNYLIEFVRPLKRAFPSAKFLFPVRDPRGVLGSRIHGIESFKASPPHLLSVMRAWRSYIAHAHSLARMFPKDTLIVPYEQLVASPKPWIGKICSLLSLTYEDAMLGESGFSQGGKTWQNNSVFEQNPAGIFTGSIEKWRQVLPEDAVKGIEFLAYHEMKLLGYHCEQVEFPVSSSWAQEVLKEYCEGEGFAWRCDSRPFVEEIECEQRRHELIRRGTASASDIADTLLTTELASLLGVRVQ